ncbi:MAG: FKBP-type peptidyl-prolyl cis-trans isomerase [Bacteroides sp.]|nr:FKBP-type peptidyl-prolyl cis-trans isomerase [Bacteroides sp.]
MNKKQLYQQENQAFLQTVANRPEVRRLPKGILYEVLKEGEGEQKATPRSIVSVYYKGSLINGKVFDDNTRQGFPDAFRLNDLIVGWQIAIPQMRVGDKWRIYLPSEVGYGSMSVSGIPKNSTLIFEIELVSVA